MSDASVGEPTGPSKHSYDVVIVGSGMGGGTLAYALADSGVDVLLIERGDFLPQEKQNWDPRGSLRRTPVRERRAVVRHRGQAVQPRHVLLRRREHEAVRLVARAVPS